MRHWNNGTDHRHSKSCCDKSSPARRTMNAPLFLRIMNLCRLLILFSLGPIHTRSLSGVPDFFDRNKILSGYDLSHYQVPHCIRVFFYFVWFVFIHHNFQFYFKLCTYCNILDIYLSWNLNFVNYLLFYMKLLNYLFFNMFGSILECCELTGVSLLWPWLIKWK